MSVHVQSRVWQASKQRGGALVLLLAIADFADDAGVAFPSVATLAQKARMSDRNAQLCLKALVDSGELGITAGAGPQGCHLYRVFPTGEDVAPRNVFGGEKTAGRKKLQGGVKPASPKPPVEPLEEEKEKTPLPPNVQRFDAVMRESVPGYNPPAVFLRKVAQNYGALDLEEEAIKIGGWLEQHPKRACSALFLLGWLKRATSPPPVSEARVVPIRASPSQAKPIGAPPDVPPDSPFLKYVRATP